MAHFNLRNSFDPLTYDLFTATHSLLKDAGPLIRNLLYDINHLYPLSWASGIIDGQKNLYIIDLSTQW